MNTGKRKAEKTDSEDDERQEKEKEKEKEMKRRNGAGEGEGAGAGAGEGKVVKPKKRQLSKNIGGMNTAAFDFGMFTVSLIMSTSDEMLQLVRI